MQVLFDDARLSPIRHKVEANIVRERLRGNRAYFNFNVGRHIGIRVASTGGTASGPRKHFGLP